jgi:hypothetical protein
MLALLGVVAVLAGVLALYFRRLAREQRALLLDVLHRLDALRADPASGGVVASAVPSTEPTTPASPVPRSQSQVVPFEQQMTRALERFEANIRVPPALEKRWLERLAALRVGRAHHLRRPDGRRVRRHGPRAVRGRSRHEGRARRDRPVARRDHEAVGRHTQHHARERCSAQRSTRPGR